MLMAYLHNRVLVILRGFRVLDFFLSVRFFDVATTKLFNLINLKNFFTQFNFCLQGELPPSSLLLLLLLLRLLLLLSLSLTSGVFRVI